ncbi:MAG: rhomboid family intramembrane serine protease [Desulfobacterales bacterium]|nr:rhomboid family intramembrane serine protease [Desulfobacterales bacterium]
MIPLRDTTPSENYPIVNNLIIGINVLIFLLEISQGDDSGRFLYIYGLVPARYSVPQIAAYFSFGQQLFSLLSFMFLHGGLWHLLGNMWSLYIFGDNVEDRLGHLRYLLFYLLCGVTSGLWHFFFNQHSNIPTIGASGSIAGVMGAYFILHPRSKILTLIPILFIPYFIEIPAFFFLGLWLLLQFLNAAGSQGGAGGIAWWAHIGGFIFGMIFLKVFTLLPRTGFTDKVSKSTVKKKTHRLQVIRPMGREADEHLYGTITITPYESHTGTRKTVNIPRGFKKRLFNVHIPAGIQQGSILRLKDVENPSPGKGHGDLLLKVIIR